MVYIENLSAPRFVTTPPVVQVYGVSKRYGRVSAVDNVDVTVYPGEILGIVGESGSGKSTLLRMLNLEEAPDTGRYQLAIPGYEEHNLFALDRLAQRNVRIHHIGIVCPTRAKARDRILSAPDVQQRRHAFDFVGHVVGVLKQPCGRAPVIH